MSGRYLAVDLGVPVAVSEAPNHKPPCLDAREQHCYWVAEARMAAIGG